MAKRIRILFCEQDMTIFSVLTALSMTISTIVLALTGDPWEGVGGVVGGSPSKNEGVLNKLLNRLADALKRLAREAVEALPAIVGSVVGAILSFSERQLDLLLNIHGI